MTFYKSQIPRRKKPRKFKYEDDPLASELFAEAWAQAERKATGNVFIEPLPNTTSTFAHVIKARQATDKIIGKDVSLYKQVCEYLFNNWPNKGLMIYQVYSLKSVEKLLFRFAHERNIVVKELIKEESIFPVYENRFNRMVKTRRITFEQGIAIAVSAPSIFPPEFIEYLRKKHGTI